MKALHEMIDTCTQRLADTFKYDATAGYPAYANDNRKG